MRQLVETAHEIADRLKAKAQTVAIAESSSGGLISAALLAVPRASKYFIGGAVTYTRTAKERHLGVGDEDFAQSRTQTETHALILAKRVREALGTTWGVSETGAAGPDGNSYGDGPGHTCVAVSGPIDSVVTVETRRSDRLANMEAFAGAALELFLNTVNRQSR